MKGLSALAEFRKVNHWKDQGEITLDTSIKELRGTNFFETLPVFPFAKKLVDYLFSPRNSIDPGEAYRLFRGRDAKIEALMRDRGFPLKSQ